MKRNILTAFLIAAFFGLFGEFSVFAQNVPNGSYVYTVKESENSSDFTLKFERGDSVYYSYAYEGAGTIEGKWTTKNGLIKITLARGKASWTFRLKPQGDDLELTEAPSKTGMDETPDFTKILPAGTIFKKVSHKASGPDLTVEDFSNRALKLIKSVRSLKDFAPENIKRQTKINVSFNKENRREYGFGGNVKDAANWTYSLIAYPYPLKNNKTTDTLQFSLDYQLHEPTNPDLSAVCIDFDAFGQELTKAGFSTPTPIRGELDRIIYWQSARGKTALNISANSKDESNKRLCIKMLTVSVTK